MTTGLFCNAEVDVPEPEGVADPEGVPEPKRAGAVTLSNHNLDLFKCEQETTTAGVTQWTTILPANIPQTQLQPQASQQLTNKDNFFFF